METPKTIAHYFRDWEGSAFGYGYGTGEGHILHKLRQFMATCSLNENNSVGYDFRELETAIGPESTWFLINVLCKHDIIEYGTSPRFAWLTLEGRRLRDFVLSVSEQELYDAVTLNEDEVPHCYHDACNCGPEGYQEGVLCANPFWADRVKEST